MIEPQQTKSKDQTDHISSGQSERSLNSCFLKPSECTQSTNDSYLVRTSKTNGTKQKMTDKQSNRMCRSKTSKNKCVTQAQSNSQSTNDPSANHLVPSSALIQASSQNSSQVTNLSTKFTHKLSVKNCNKMKDTQELNRGTDSKIAQNVITIDDKI